MKNSRKIFIWFGVLVIILGTALVFAFVLYPSKTDKTKTENSKNFTIIVLPDTQFYSQNYPQIFNNQTQWIADQAKNMNIVFVVHEGDIVNKYKIGEQWQNANAALLLLDGKVPYAVLPGNHDMSSKMETTFFNK